MHAEVRTSSIVYASFEMSIQNRSQVVKMHTDWQFNNQIGGILATRRNCDNESDVIRPTGYGSNDLCGEEEQPELARNLQSLWLTDQKITPKAT